MFSKKGVLRNFAKFTGKHLCQSLIFNKVDRRPVNSLKWRLRHRFFSCEFYEISKNTFSYRTPPVAASTGSNFVKETNTISNTITNTISLYQTQNGNGEPIVDHKILYYCFFWSFLYSESFQKL